MALLVAMVIAASLGWILRYVLPNRETYGVALTAGVCAAVTGLVWSGLLFWTDMYSEQVGIWLISIGAGVVVALIVPFLAGARRPKRDARLLEELMNQPT